MPKLIISLDRFFSSNLHWPSSRRIVLRLIVGGCLYPSVAFAGEWVASYEAVSGDSGGQSGYQTDRGSEYDPWFNESFTFDWVTNAYTDRPDDYKSLNQSPYREGPVQPTAGATRGVAWADAKRRAAQVTSSGQARVVWNWRPSQGQTDAGPVPPFINFLVSASSTAFACNHFDAADSSVAANRNRTGETGAVSVSLGVTAKTSHVVNNSNSGWSATAMRLYQIKTEGQTRIEGPVVGLSAQASIPDGRYNIKPAPPFTNLRIPNNHLGGVGVNTTVTSSLDDREVWLTRRTGTNTKQYVDGQGFIHPKATPPTPIEHIIITTLETQISTVIPKRY